MEIASWIIGTLILLGLHAFVTMPLAKALSKSRLKGKSLADSEQLINEVSGDTNEVSNEVKIPTGIYIFSDRLCNLFSVISSQKYPSFFNNSTFY